MRYCHSRQSCSFSKQLLLHCVIIDFKFTVSQAQTHIPELSSVTKPQFTFSSILTRYSKISKFIQSNFLDSVIFSCLLKLVLHLIFIISENFQVFAIILVCLKLFLPLYSKEVSSFQLPLLQAFKALFLYPLMLFIFET